MKVNLFKYDTYILFYSAVAALAVFIADLIFPLGVAAGVPYILTILLVSSHSKITHIWVAAIGTSVLVFVGLYLSPSGGILWVVLTNRFLAILAIWITAILTINSKKRGVEELMMKNEALEFHKKTSEDRAALLREIHHRVKNNLQLTVSMLKLQSGKVIDVKVKAALEITESRIKSMSLVHEMLYETEDFSKIDYGQYIEELVSQLLYSMQDPAHPVSLKLDMPTIFLNIDTAIPLGLLINEIIINSIKHGLNSDVGGEIEISLKEENETDFSLYIGDNGKGYTEVSILENPESLGLTLITTLVSQLHGSIKKDLDKKGTYYIIHLKKLDKKGSR